MTPELDELNRNPPDEEKVFAEIGRTVVAIQPTEALFNIAVAIVIPDRPFTVENLGVMSGDERTGTLGQLKSHLVKKLKIPFEPAFLSSLEKFIDDRNRLVHKAGEIPGWDLSTSRGRIAAFIFLKNLQLQNLVLHQILLGLVMLYDRKHIFGAISKVTEECGLWPQAKFYEQIAKEVFGFGSTEFPT